MEKEKLDKLIALTFDEDPKVRKQALKELALVDDALALIAITELTFDKDKEVAEEAKRILEERKKNIQHSQLPLSDLFKGVSFSGKEEVVKQEEKEKTSNKIVDSIRDIFIKKYKDKSIGERAFEMFISQVKKSTTPQQFITAYIETRDLEKTEKLKLENEEKVKKEKNIEQKAIEKDIEPLEIIGEKINTELIAQEEKLLEDDELFKEEKKILEEFKYPPTAFSIALNELSAVEDEKASKKLSDMLIQFFKKQVELAYKVVRKKFKAIKITDLSEIKDGMKNITTDILEIVEIKEIPYKDRGKEKILRRVVLRDKGGKEGVLYLFDDRGSILREGMKISLEKAKAKTFKFSNETALTLDKRGKGYIHF